MRARWLPLVAFLLVSAAAAQPSGGPPAGGPAIAAPDSATALELAGRLADRGGALTGYETAYYPLSELNAGLEPPAEEPNLQTPQAALEYFVRAARDERFRDAAAAMNLNLLGEERQAALAPELAQHLYYVLDSQLGFDWEGLPDRPDGATLQPAPGTGNALVGQPRRSLRIGSLALGGGDAVVRLQRVKPAGQRPVWVFSPQTVENVPALYRRYGPGPIDRSVPAWARVEVWGQTALWTWLALAVGLVLAVLFAWGVRALTRRWLRGADSHWLRGLSSEVATPVAAFVGLLLLYLHATLGLALPGAVTTTLLVLLIGAFVWLASRTISFLTEHIAREQGVESLKELSGGEGTREQQWLTYLSVGRRVLLFVVFLLGVGLILSQFDALQTLGFSLMASAGVATVVLGIAAQPVLGNIIASIQIALSKPVRIGDSVLYEGNWGYVEDITYTFLLIQTWDQRRLVVPLRYFITHPFENWTMRSAHLIKPIVFHADYTLDVPAVRAKFEELLRASDDWDEEQEPKVQVVAAGEETLEVRALCSAKDPSTAWDLHCRLREELVAFVRDLEGGRYLPRQRVESANPEAAAAHADADGAADDA